MSWDDADFAEYIAAYEQVAPAVAPWQIEILRRAMRGEQVFINHPRGFGRRAAERLWAEAMFRPDPSLPPDTIAVYNADRTERRLIHIEQETDPDATGGATIDDLIDNIDEILNDHKNESDQTQSPQRE